jgi:hypothetical protein
VSDLRERLQSTVNTYHTIPVNTNSRVSRETLRVVVCTSYVTGDVSYKVDGSHYDVILGAHSTGGNAKGIVLHFVLN